MINNFLVFILAILPVLAVHEAAHALVAYYLGDPTAKLQGRLSLNPLKHLDFFGSVVFLITQSFGWGKPVPVNPWNFKHPIRGNALVALAGPISNFLFAFLIVLLLAFLNFVFGDVLPDFIGQFLFLMFQLNVVLGVFNLIPFPPLDGSKIIGLFVSKRFESIYQKFMLNGLSYFILFFLFDLMVIRSVFGFSLITLFVMKGSEILSAILLFGV